MSGEDTPYRVDRHGEAYAVYYAEEMVCVCGDERNAGQYEALLTQAYRRGYKAGYRAAKRSS